MTAAATATVCIRALALRECRYSEEPAVGDSRGAIRDESSQVVPHGNSCGSDCIPLPMQCPEVRPGLASSARKMTMRNDVPGALQHRRQMDSLSTWLRDLGLERYTAVCADTEER